MSPMGTYFLKADAYSSMIRLSPSFSHYSVIIITKVEIEKQFTSQQSSLRTNPFEHRTLAQVSRQLSPRHTIDELGILPRLANTCFVCIRFAFSERRSRGRARFYPRTKPHVTSSTFGLSYFITSSANHHVLKNCANQRERDNPGKVTDTVTVQSGLQQG